MGFHDVEVDPMKMCESLVGFDDVEVLALEKIEGDTMQVHVRSTRPRPKCRGCDGKLQVKQWRSVILKDRPGMSSRRVEVMFHKRRLQCRNVDCEVKSFTEQRPDIAAEKASMTTRLCHWIVEQAIKGYSVNSIAKTIGCNWNAVNNVILKYGGKLLEVDTERTADVRAVGLDENLMVCEGPMREQRWMTVIVDVDRVKLLGVVPGKDASEAIEWLQDQPQKWREEVQWGALDMAGAYRKVYNEALPDTGQVVDLFHLISAANDIVNATRRTGTEPDNG